MGGSCLYVPQQLLLGLAGPGGLPRESVISPQQFHREAQRKNIVGGGKHMKRLMIRDSVSFRKLRCDWRGIVVQINMQNKVGIRGVKVSWFLKKNKSISVLIAS